MVFRRSILTPQMYHIFMNRKDLYNQIQAKKSMLCVGLDVDFDKMPEHVKALANHGEVAIKGELFKGKARSIVEFNKAIVDATAQDLM